MDVLDERPPTVPPAGPAPSAVLLRMGAGRYAVDLGAVSEVGRAPALTRLPQAPAWLPGVANWRGRVLAVLDLRPLLDGAATTPGPHSRLVVLRQAAHTVGVLADQVEEIVGIPAPDGVAPMPVSGTAAGLLAGHLVAASGPIGVIDVGAVFELRNRLQRPRRAAG